MGKSAKPHCFPLRLAISELVLAITLCTRPASATNMIAYNHSDGATQAVYREILHCIENHKTETEVSTTNISVLKRAFETVLADHGELFWTSNAYSYRFGPAKGVFYPEYTMDRRRREDIQRRIDARVRHLLRDCPETASDYEKAKFVYRTLVREIDYDRSAPMNQTVAGPFLYGRTVCRGYSCATQYLLRELGIESTIVSGRARGGSHAWIIALLDGEYYHIDTTWGEPTCPDKEEQQDDNIDWWYLNLTTREISQDHAIISPFAPLCSATEDNYFVKEGLFLPFWSPENAEALLLCAWENGRRTIPLKFASFPDRNSAVRHFISRDGVRALFPELGTFWYNNPDNRPMLSIIGLPPPPTPDTGNLQNPGEMDDEDYPLDVASSAKPSLPEYTKEPTRPEATEKSPKDGLPPSPDTASSTDPSLPEPEPPPPPQRFGAVVFRIDGEELDILADGAFEIGLGELLEVSVQQSNTKVSIDWGDETTHRGSKGFHVYESPGEYTIIVKAKGEYGKTFRPKTFVVYVKGGHGFFLFVFFLLAVAALVALNVRRNAAHDTEQRICL